MFTGIVEEVGAVEAIESGDAGAGSRSPRLAPSGLGAGRLGGGGRVCLTRASAVRATTPSTPT